MLTEWPPSNLDGDSLHILVTFGDPFSPRLQRTKLQSLLNRVPTGDAWQVYCPDVFYMGGCCGAVFSTADRASFERELRVVREIRHGARVKAGKGAHHGSSFADPTAYTDLRVIDVDTSVEEASEAFDRALAEYDSTARKTARGRTSEVSGAPSPRPGSKEGAPAAGRRVDGGEPSPPDKTNTKVTVVTVETTPPVRHYSYEVPSSFDLGGDWPLGRDGNVEWAVGKGDSASVAGYLARVWEGHKEWLALQENITRNQWTNHLETYEKDRRLDGVTKENFLSLLRVGYLAGERQRYGLPAGVKHNGGISVEVFHQQLSLAFEEHLGRVRSEETMDERSFHLLRLYDEDPLMSQAMRDRLYTAVKIRYDRWITAPLPPHVQEQMDACGREWRDTHRMLMYSMRVPETVEGLRHQERTLYERWGVGEPPEGSRWPTPPPGDTESSDDEDAGAAASAVCKTGA